VTLREGMLRGFSTTGMPKRAARWVRFSASGSLMVSRVLAGDAVWAGEDALDSTTFGGTCST
jgi:hypothetical protein